jgi:hypothetical protein
MTYMLERPRVRRPFERADILSLMGETICLSEVPDRAPKRRPEETVPQVEAPCWDEEPERWDGMA